MKSSNNLVFDCFGDSWKFIVKYKKWFLLCFILQLLFMIVLLGSSSYFVARVIEKSQVVLAYVNTLNLDPYTARLDILNRESPLGDNPELITNNYRLILNNIGLLVIVSLFIYVIFNSILWFLAQFFSKKKDKFKLKNYFIFLVKFFLLSIIHFILLLIVIFSSVNVFFSTFLQSNPSQYVLLLIIGLLGFYFTLPSIPLFIKNSFLSSLKKSFFFKCERIPNYFSSVCCLGFINCIQPVLSLFDDR